MRIKKLIMHNFGVYASTNELTFSGDKPIVLIGGMNGRGKTTILEAVLLGLYGPNSYAYMESPFQTYGQYLKSYVNKADGTLETYINLEFSMEHSDKEIYSIHREWDAKGVRVRETITVWKNGEPNDFLTKNWLMFIESVLPSALSSFFFFDGEKIAELAVEDTSERLKESIKAMLGISVLDVLENDLVKIIRRFSKKTADNQDLTKLNQLREHKKKSEGDLNAVDQKIEKMVSHLDQLNLALEKKNNEYFMKGGEIADQKYELLQKRSEHLAMISDDQEKLIEMAAGMLPLRMVTSFLTDIQTQGELEHDKKTSIMAVARIKEFYSYFLKKQTNTSEDIDAFLHFIETKVYSDKAEMVYNLSDTTLYQIKKLINHQLKETSDQVENIIIHRNKTQTEIDEIDKYLSIDLDETALNKLYKSIRKIEKEIIDSQVDLEALQKERKNLHGILMTAELAFSKNVETVLSALESKEADERTIKYANMAIEIISLYRTRLQERKVDVLANTITNCYKKLSNKKNLVTKIKMDAKTLDLHYINHQDEEIEKKRLSAGEKQLMVISLLWALAICSKKKLPVIVDTPLSRLDLSHRLALIKTYFPNASDQTIILSTDAEIDKTYYEMLRPEIGDAYTLTYNDLEQKTTIKPGYFGLEV